MALKIVWVLISLFVAVWLFSRRNDGGWVENKVFKTGVYRDSLISIGAFLVLHYTLWILNPGVWEKTEGQRYFYISQILVIIGGVVWMRKKPTILKWLGRAIVAGSLLISLRILNQGMIEANNGVTGQQKPSPTSGQPQQSTKVPTVETEHPEFKYPEGRKPPTKLPFGSQVVVLKPDGECQPVYLPSKTNFWVSGAVIIYVPNQTPVRFDPWKQNYPVHISDSNRWCVQAGGWEPVQLVAIPLLSN